MINIVRKLYAIFGIPCTPNEESRPIQEFITKVRDLAESSGGDNPLPERPDVRYLNDLISLSSNDQVKKLSELSSKLTSDIYVWQSTKQKLEQRIPIWNKLQRMLYHSKKLSVYLEVQSQVKAIEDNRSILDEPNPVEPLCDKLAESLRSELTKYHAECEDIYAAGVSGLEMNESWKSLTDQQKSEILLKSNLNTISQIDISSDEGIIETLDSKPLDWWNTLKDALPKRFDDALSNAIDLVGEGKIQVVNLESRLLKSENDLDLWQSEIKQKILPYLKDGKYIQVK
jgi:hypothetical protein